MSSSGRRHLHAALPKPNQASKSGLQSSATSRPSHRRHFLLVCADVPDKSSLLANLSHILPPRSLVGTSCSWCPSERLKVDDVSNSLEDAPKSIKTLIDKMDKPVSLDIILLIGMEELPKPEDAIELFNLLDNALNDCSYQAMIRIVCLETTRLNDWDLLLGASVVRLQTFADITASCFDDKNIVFRGSIILGGGKAISGIRLSIKDEKKLPEARKLFSCHGGSLQIKALARVRLDSVPVILFRKSFRGQMHWSASRSTGHRMLSLWSDGLGVMSDAHGLFMQIIGGPMILLYSSDNCLYYRTVISVEEEAKMVAVKQALYYSDRYACSSRITNP